MWHKIPSDQNAGVLKAGTAAANLKEGVIDRNGV